MSASLLRALTRPTTLAALICLASFVLYEMLIQYYPVVFCGDSHIRLALRDQILLGHWLPLLQILIFGVAKINTGLFIIRTLLSLIAVGALAGMYQLGSRLFAPATGLIAMAFLAVNTMFVAFAIVPYTEVLFIGLVLFALYLMDHPDTSPRFYVGVLALNLACLTRYEGWPLAAIFMLEATWRSLQSRNWGKIILEVPGKAFLYGIAPLAWLIFGVQEPGGLGDRLKAIITFEAETKSQPLVDRLLSSFNADYLRAFVANYYHLWEWQAGLAIIVLGAAGWLLAILFAQRRALHWRILAFVVSDWLLLALWQPQDFTSLRTAFIGEVFLILYAAHGLQQLALLLFEKLAALLRKAGILAWQGWVTSGVVLVMLYISVTAAVNLVAVSSHESDFYVPAQVGAWLGEQITEKDAIWVLGDRPLQSYALATYLRFPFDTIVDDERFDTQLIHSHLASARLVYIVELYKSKAGLSAEESALLADLESGRIPAQLFPVGSTRVWVVTHNVFVFLP